jgi:hypothetical protein
MASSAEYRQFAEECIQSARTSKSAEIRKHFLDLAKLWATAAQQMDDGIEAPEIVQFERQIVEHDRSRRRQHQSDEEEKMRAVYAALGMSDRTTEAAIQARRVNPVAEDRDRMREKFRRAYRSRQS